MSKDTAGAADYTEAQAQDPDTDLVDLARMAYERPDLRPSVAANPSAYPDLLVWLQELGDPQVDAALAGREEWDAEDAQATLPPTGPEDSDPFGEDGARPEAREGSSVETSETEVAGAGRPGGPADVDVTPSSATPFGGGQLSAAPHDRTAEMDLTAGLRTAEELTLDEAEEPEEVAFVGQEFGVLPVLEDPRDLPEPPAEEAEEVSADEADPLEEHDLLLLGPIAGEGEVFTIREDSSAHEDGTLGGGEEPVVGREPASASNGSRTHPGEDSEVVQPPPAPPARSTRGSTLLDGWARPGPSTLRRVPFGAPTEPIPRERPSVPESWTRALEPIPTGARRLARRRRPIAGLPDWEPLPMGGRPVNDGRTRY